MAVGDKPLCLPVQAKENSSNTASLCSDATEQGNHDEIQMDTKGTNKKKKSLCAVTFKASCMLSQETVKSS